MKLIKDGKVIEATEKVYNLIYKHRGFKIYNPDTHLLSYLEKEIDKIDEFDAIEEEEVEVTQEPIADDSIEIDIVDYQTMTNDQLKVLLTSKGIGYNARDNKTRLIEILTEGE